MSRDKLNEMRWKLWCDVYVAVTGSSLYGGVQSSKDMADKAVRNFMEFIGGDLPEREEEPEHE